MQKAMETVCKFAASTSGNVERDSAAGSSSRSALAPFSANAQFWSPEVLGKALRNVREQIQMTSTAGGSPSSFIWDRAARGEHQVQGARVLEAAHHLPRGSRGREASGQVSARGLLVERAARVLGGLAGGVVKMGKRRPRRARRNRNSRSGSSLIRICRWVSSKERLAREMWRQTSFCAVLPEAKVMPRYAPVKQLSSADV